MKNGNWARYNGVPGKVVSVSGEVLELYYTDGNSDTVNIHEVDLIHDSSEIADLEREFRA